MERNQAAKEKSSFAKPLNNPVIEKIRIKESAIQSIGIAIILDKVGFLEIYYANLRWYLLLFSFSFYRDWVLRAKYI